MDLVDICELIVDCEHKTAPTQDEGYPSIRTPNIGRGYLILDGVNRVSEETYRLWTKRAIPQAGDLIMAREAPVGNVAMIPPGLHPCLGQRTLLIRPDQSKVDGNFLNYYLNGPFVQGLIHAKTNGATVPHLNMKEVRSMPVPPLPPLPIQRRIASILSAYDDLIENSQRRIKILEEMARRLYREWFVHFRFPGHEGCRFVESPLGEIPEGWEVKSLGDICTRMESGGTPKRSTVEYWDGGVIDWYKTGELWDGFLFEAQEKISVRGQRESTARLFDPGTILMAIYGSPTVGRMGILTAHASCNQAALGLVADKRIISQTYLYFILYSLRDHFNGLAQGAAQQNISKEKVSGALAVVPSRQVLELFDNESVPIFEQLRTLQQQIQTLRRTRDLLLPRLLSGQIDVEALPDPSATANVLPDAADSLS